MRIKKPEINIEQIKSATKTAKKTAKKVAQKTQETAKVAAKNVSEKLDDFSQFAQETTQDAQQAYLRIFHKPKLERLSGEITDTKIKIMKKELELKRLQSEYPKDGIKIWQVQKDLALLGQNLSKLTEEYNDFAQKQAACQEMFEKLNK